MNRKVKFILVSLACILISILGRFLAIKFNLPITGNQFPVLFAACYMNPLYSIIITIVSGVICSIFDEYWYLYIIPLLVGSIICMLVLKRRDSINNIFRTISVICFVGLAEGFILAIEERVILEGTGHTLLSYTDSLYEMLIYYNIPVMLIYTLVGLFTVYADVTISLVFLWFFYFIRNPLQKKKERRAYLKRNMAGLMLLLFCMEGCFLAFPQYVEASDETNYIQQIFNEENGLAGGAANDIVQSEDGTIWVGTYEGLYKYNGEKFNFISDIPNVRSVMCLLVGSDGSLWIGNNGTGLVVVTPDQKYLSCDYYDGMPSDGIREIEQLNSDTYYVATAKGLAILKYDGTELKVENVLSDNQYINQVAVSHNDIIAYYSSDKNVTLVKNGTIIQQISVETYDISTVCFDNDNNLYVGKSTNEIDIYSNNDEEYVKTGTINTDTLVSVTHMLFDNDNIYLSAQNGLGVLDKDRNIKPIFVSGFESNINNILKDYQDNIWFASSRNGLLRMEKSVFTDLFSVYGADECVANSEIEWGNFICVGTDDGLLIFDKTNGERVENELTELFAHGSRIRCVFVDSKDSLWLSNYNGGTAEITKNGDIYFYNNELDNFVIGNKARFTVELNDGTTLISHNGGIAFIKNHKVVDYLVCGEKMSSAYALSILSKDNGNLLIGTDGEGVLIVENNEVIKKITRGDGISSGVVLRLIDDPFSKGTFVLTGSGLCYLDENYVASEVKGFPYFNNLDMWITNDGNVFVLSSAGIFVCEYDNIFKEETNAILLDRSAGLPSSLTSNPWNYLSEDGILYLAGSSGVYTLDTNNYLMRVSSYKPSVSGVSFDDENVSMTNSRSIIVPAGVKKVTLFMQLNNYTSANPYVRYYLSGVDDSKHIVKSNELLSVTYDKLAHGDYDFYIEVLDDNKENVIAKSVFHITKELETYETNGFMVYFYIIISWMLITIVIAISVVTNNLNNTKHRHDYDKVVAKLEKEKSQALQQALQNEAQANKSKSDFLASMSHEIRTPINAIIGMDTMILRESNQDSVKKYASDVKSASETLLALINDILDFSKIESGKMELVLGEYDSCSLINDLVNMIRPKAEGKNLTFTINVDPNIPTHLYGDMVRVKQIIINILNNAVKYTEKGGVELFINSEKVDEKQIALTVKVADTGIGIKEQDLQKLFSPYERIEENRNKNVEGTGLGMSITKKLLNLMNSSLIVESVYGEGSTFSFTILQQIESDEVIGNIEERLNSISESENDIELFHAPQAHILVVDDVDMNLMVATSLLKRTQIKVSTAASGMAAIELSKTNKYDVILLDSMMPEMSGEETLKIIKSECEINLGTPVIVLTANAIKGAKEEYLKAGFDDYLSKPIDGNKLEEMLKKYLPEDKILAVTDANSNVGATEENENSVISDTNEVGSKFGFWESISKVSGIDVSKGIEAAGGKDIYENVCHNFFDTAASRIELIERYFEEMDISNYTIQVHALKSSARLIGANALSQKALEMEMAGREENIELIKAKTEDVLHDYRTIMSELEAVFCEEEINDKPELSEKKLKRKLVDMQELLQAFDFETAKELFNSFNEYKLPDSFLGSYKAIRVRMSEVDIDGIIEILQEYLG